VWLVHSVRGGLVLVSANHAILEGSAEIRPWSLPNQEVNMYAVIKTGGKQYRVASGEKIKVEQIAADVGQEIVATVVAHGKHDKVRIFKMRRRKHYQKRQGHRQQFTELQIGAIAG
jgi:large subunit ribosomal protein L21